MEYPSGRTSYLGPTQMDILEEIPAQVSAAQGPRSGLKTDSNFKEHVLNARSRRLIHSILVKTLGGLGKGRTGEEQLGLTFS